MEKFVYRTSPAMTAAAAGGAAETIKNAIKTTGRANIILATGASQIEMLGCLTRRRRAEGVDWSKVTMFHLDEYIGLGPDHPAGFGKYLRERFVEKVERLKAAHFVNGDAEDPKQECKRIGRIIAKHPIDVALIGIGENGHLAFNDPPADFETEEPYIVVELDERCRKQQLGEGWFETLEQVPRRAISMSIRQILKSKSLIVTVPDRRKAEAVKKALEGPVTLMCPASILQQHDNCRIFLDAEAACLLTAR
ncbi:MAG TPA: glucosamine-6-phosphate deaminase [Sedimentisphaerales bacterium]|nr:glucosamine-6-phosphate deaminase [Sedimentisphaerales bacterium]